MLIFVSLVVSFSILSTSVNTLPTADYGSQLYEYGSAPPSAEIPIEDNIDYKYVMKIQDDDTYNYQTKKETKLSGVVQGMYAFLEPDGNYRVVKYIADDSGFRAVVINENGYQQNNDIEEYDEFDQLYNDINQQVASLLASSASNTDQKITNAEYK